MSPRIASPVPTRDRPGSDVPADSGGPSPMEAVEIAFRLLGCEPDPLAVDGRRIGQGLPAEVLPLPRLREVLLDRATGYGARDAVWRELVTRARGEGPAWVVGATGMALPGLRRQAGVLVRSREAGREVEAEMLAAFVAGLRSVDLTRGRIASRLCFLAFNAARRLRRREAEVAGRQVPLAESAMPARPSGHPDFVLARAVRCGVITRAEARLIGATRLEGVALEAAAAERGISSPAAWMSRERAESRLVAALASGELDEL